jgi:hypothetical protein
MRIRDWFQPSRSSSLQANDQCNTAPQYKTRFFWTTWSSYRSYAYGERGIVRINDWRWWEEKIRVKTG